MELEPAAAALLEQIRRQNLGAYEAMPSRVDEDVAQESQIVQDYRGRLTFELLQNADDAMAQGGFAERIVFRLTDDALEVGNSGRALTPEDVAGLCGTGASSKTAVTGRRRASIGHKGMGFKSVLEITDQPQVVSDTTGFRLDARLSEPTINLALDGAHAVSRKRVPTMRLPWPLEHELPSWAAAQDEGLRVLFRFPLRASLSVEQRRLLARRLLDLPVTAILFLKHLDDVEVDVRTKSVVGHFRWRITRERREDGEWVAAPGFGSSGVYRVHVASDDGTDLTFVIAHDADVEIGLHRNGLDAVAWDDVDLSEVSLAIPWPAGTAMPEDWARFHVFLPTLEKSPYPMLVNGAFRTDLSRQEIRVGEDELDYNRHLLRATAMMFASRLLPALRDERVSVRDLLSLLDRNRVPGSRVAGGAAATLHDAFRAALSDIPFIPGEGDLTLSTAELVVPPPTADTSVGAAFRNVLVADASHGDRWFPSAAMCEGRMAAILTDLGAQCLTVREAAEVLAGADSARSRMHAHPTVGERLRVDPVLDVLGRLWADCRGKDRAELEHAARECALFPVAVAEDGTIRRERTDGTQCYYPPHRLVGEVPLKGLQFMLQQVCWGELTPPERTNRLHDEAAAWQALFGIREFKFPDVMRSSVFPALELELTPDAAALRVALQSVDMIAAICQLSGRSTNAASPLPNERLGSNRALFNLARLRLPCRPRRNGVERWEPAYRVYFGDDWIDGIGDSSVERVLKQLDRSIVETLDVPLLAAPDVFLGRLARYEHLAGATSDDEDENIEVGESEDEETALESNEPERWVNFLTWLGVNRVLRPVALQDVLDSGAGWLSTVGLSKPKGWAFAGLGDIWDAYATEVRERLGNEGGDAARYFYGLHDLEYSAPLLLAAHHDTSGSVARALFAHLAHGWPQLSGFSRLSVALSSDPKISRRTPPKPADDELRYPADNFWLHRLRQAGWVPSTHGPRPPKRVWRQSAEIDRRFGRRGAVAGDLIALLEVDRGVPAGRADSLAQQLGIRADLSPAAFDEADARALLARLETIFAPLAAAGALEERTLREVIRPAYRNLLELMGGGTSDDEDDESVGVEASLRDAHVLVHDGSGSYRFVPGHDAFYLSRSGTRERLGQPRIQTFVLETSVTARRALRQLGIRTLETALEWLPRPGTASLDEQELTAFHAGLAELAPYVLARLRADRGDDRTAARDASRLRDLLAAIEPVDRLGLECRLDGRTLLDSDARDSHVSEGDDGALLAYVRWGERGWPPTSAEANALATLLVDGVGAGAFEAYLALVIADGADARHRLLRYAGADADVDLFRDILAGAEPPEPSPRPPGGEGERTTTEEGEAWLAGGLVTPPQGGETHGRVPLYRPDQLLIDGIVVTVTGQLPEDRDRDRGDNNDPGGGGGGRGGWRRGATDVDELNELGMWVALNFERNRLRRAGQDQAEIFLAGSAGDQARVFDVSTPDAIKAADRESVPFREALDRLVRLGLASRHYPGFDILTLAADGQEERLIELKSSGIDAQVQSMTWNEWKTARESTLRTRFYLYLVSNLRSDLALKTPYLRAVRDPFGSLWQHQIIESGVERSVQLSLKQFTLAEESKLTVLGWNEPEPPAN